MKRYQALPLIILSLLPHACGVADTGRAPFQGAYPDPEQQLADSSGARDSAAQTEAYPVPLGQPILPDPSVNSLPTMVTVQVVGEYPPPKLGIILSPEGEILFIASGSPADRSGLKIGDRVTALDDVPLDGMLRAREHIDKTRPQITAGKQGPPIQIHLLREGREQSLPVLPEIEIPGKT